MDLREDIFIFNSLDKDVSCKAFGKWFTFKAGAYKLMRHEIAEWLSQQKGYLGLVTLDANFSDPEYSNSEEGKAALEAKRQEGVSKRVRHLQAQVSNLQHSLIQDLRAKDFNVDPNTAANYATDGDLAAMDELFVYQKAMNDKSKVRADAAKVKLRQLSSITQTRPASDSIKAKD